MSEANHGCRPSAVRKRTVYIIDDDQSVRTALERLLVSAGFSTRTFPAAIDFLDAPVKRHGACVISDVKMHGISGLQLARALREAGEEVFFIFVTAYDTEESRREAQQIGAIAYFRKPVDDQALIDAIEWALDRSEKDSGGIPSCDTTKVPFCESVNRRIPPNQNSGTKEEGEPK